MCMCNLLICLLFTEDLKKSLTFNWDAPILCGDTVSFLKALNLHHCSLFNSCKLTVLGRCLGLGRQQWFTVTTRLQHLPFNRVNIDRIYKDTVRPDQVLAWCSAVFINHNKIQTRASTLCFRLNLSCEIFRYFGKLIYLSTFFLF